MGRESERRLHLLCRGRVQGVGLRPFVYRLATDLMLSGWVVNAAGEVRIEIQGKTAHLAAFVRALRRIPPPARIETLICRRRPVEAAFAPFRILPSEHTGALSPAISPDLATCPACRAELFDPAARRYRYPFTTCSHCGPRWSILMRRPFDRNQTSMAAFALCLDCQAEYENPADRRFHAQTLACPACGPQLTWHDPQCPGQRAGEDALARAVAALRQGKIVAVKGIGGFHLLTDARDDAAVARLRAMKARPAKPLAVMFPDLAAVAQSCRLDAAAMCLLDSPAAPIVLLPRRAADPLSPRLTPGLDRLGALLPYTPLHHLLMEALGFPVVATSANRPGAPLCFDDAHALRTLWDMADGFLLHDRPIVRPVEDSVVQLFEDEALMLRLGRGYAPATLPLPCSARTVLGVGGHVKNAVAMTIADRMVVGGYRGDLDHPEAHTTWQRECRELPALFGATPESLACDRHPDYVSTRQAIAEAETIAASLVAVQHHHAHLAAAVLEGRCVGPVLGVIFDGTGLGMDQTIWGGELLAWEAGRARRVGALLPFNLPGGERAAREPARAALGILAALGEPLDGASARALGYDARSLRVLARMLETGTGCVTTTSAGRLFDALSALLGRPGPVHYEGEAAMALEVWARADPQAGRAAPLCNAPVHPDAGMMRLDWRPALRQALRDHQAGRARSGIAASWHASLAALIAAAVMRRGEETVVLSGGCFQNVLLLEHTVRLLRAQGRRVFWPRHLPVNDGALAVGQAALAANLWGG